MAADNLDNSKTEYSVHKNLVIGTKTTEERLRELFRISVENNFTVVDDGDEESTRAAKRLRVSAALSTGDAGGDGIALFVTALSRRDWDLARRAVITSLSSRPNQTAELNKALCITLHLVWFLTTEDEIQAVSDLISLIISSGADDLGEAVVDTSRFVSLLPVCRTSQAHLATAFTQSWRAKTDPRTILQLQTQLEWRLNRCQFYVDLFDDRVVKKQTYNSPAVQKMQLNVIEKLLNLASPQTVTGYFTRALSEACTIQIALSNTELVPILSEACTIQISATVIPKLLDMLVKAGGSDGINNHFQLASNNGSKELVCVLLQIAHLNGFRQDLDECMAFRLAAFNCDIAMLECLAEEVDQIGIYVPFVIAVFEGSMHVVAWFVERGFAGKRLLHPLVAATCNGHELVAAYLLRQVPKHVLVVHGTALLKEVGKHNVRGVKFLLQSDFLGNPADTYSVAESIASSDDADATHDLKEYLKEHWSVKSFNDGYLQGGDHYVNVMRILKLGGSLSATKLQDLPPPLCIAITYLPLYRECVENGNECLLSQRIRGKLFQATRRLGCKLAFEDSPSKELLAQLEHCLPRFLLQKSQTQA